MANMKYLLNYRSFISLMVLFSFIDNFGMKNDTFKVLFVGDAGVGKTQIIKNFLEENFSDVYELTIGVEDISKVSNGKKIWEINRVRRLAAKF